MSRTVFLLLIPIIALAQSTTVFRIQDEEALFSALVDVGSEQGSKALMRSHRHLLTDKLWKRFEEELTKAFDSNDPAKSLFLYSIEKQIAEELNDKIRLGQVLDNVSYLYLSMAKYEKARDHSMQSLTLAEELGNKERLASALLTIGESYLGQGDYKQALEYSKKAQALATGLNDKRYLEDALLNIGHAYSMTGNYLQAFIHYNQALDAVKSSNKKRKLERVLIGLGVLYAEQGDYEKMFNHLGQALQIAKEINDQHGIATILISMGIANRQQGNIDQALQNLQESLKITEEIKSTALLIYAQAACGSIHQLQGRYDLALDFYNKGLLITEQIGDKSQMSTILWQIADLYNATKNYSKAIEFVDRAVVLANQLGLPEISYLALTVKGKAHLAIKQEGLAQRSFLDAISVIEELRSQVSGGEQDYQRFFENRISPYHAMVELLIGQSNPANALAYAERAKARVLLDVLRNGRISINKSMSEREQLEERKLYDELVSLNTQIRTERMRQTQDETHLKELQTRLQKARSAYEAFQTAVYAAHPDLKAKRGLLPSFMIEDAGSIIPDTQTALLEYVVTDTRTFLFLLTKNREQKTDIKVFSIDIRRSNLARQVGHFRNLMASNHPGFRQPARDLYALFVGPTEQYLKDKTTLCIVPDGPLWELPFQALEIPTGQYLLERQAIYYAPSLQVLREMKKRAAGLRLSPVGNNYQQNRTQLFAVGNPSLGGETLAQAQALRNNEFAPLPEAEKEVREIAATVYGLQASSIQVGVAAREENIKAEIGKYQILHFATHGVLDNVSPLYSYLVLTTDGRSNEDGILEAWELMDMDLNAEMVVLSACDTARGRVGAGEGMIGMSWALFLAGVQTTIASQWKVPSETTRLMVTFHTNAKNVSKAEAWRRAVLEMIRDPRYRMRPFHWAGFVVVGDGGR